MRWPRPEKDHCQTGKALETCSIGDGAIVKGLGRSTNGMRTYRNFIEKYLMVKAGVFRISNRGEHGILREEPGAWSVIEDARSCGIRADFQANGATLTTNDADWDHRVPEALACIDKISPKDHERDFLP